MTFWGNTLERYATFTKFFKESILGFAVTENGGRTNAEKVRAFREYEEPKNIFNLWSFRDLASYYGIH